MPNKFTNEELNQNISPIRFDNCNYQYEGSILPTNQGYYIRILHYMSYSEVVYQFCHDGLIKTSDMKSIINGEIGHPNHRNIFGGYGVGNGVYNSKDNPRTYGVWKAMIGRCSSAAQETNKRYRDNYSDCFVCEEWLNFQNFAPWYEYYCEKINFSLNDELRFEVDKDILVRGNKVYSPSTCCVVPHNINTCMNYKGQKRNASDLPRGVRFRNGRYNARFKSGGQGYNLGTVDTVEDAFALYKAAKENEIKSMAKYYLSINAILPDVYNALMNWEVRIDD